MYNKVGGGVGGGWGDGVGGVGGGVGGLRDEDVILWHLHDHKITPDITLLQSISD